MCPLLYCFASNIKVIAIFLSACWPLTANYKNHDRDKQNRNQASRSKNVFLLYSAKHEICSSYQYENANNSWHFIFISREKFIL